MKTVIILVLSLLAMLGLLLGIAALIGSQLPITHVATRSILVHRPVDEVYRLVRDVGTSPTWRSDVTNVDLLGDQNGKLHYREHGSQGEVTYELAEDVPGQKIVTRIVDQDLGYSGTWTITFAAEGDATRVTITENGEVSNVMFRFMSRYIFGHTATIDGYLAALGKHYANSK